LGTTTSNYPLICTAPHLALVLDEMGAEIPAPKESLGALVAHEALQSVLA